MQTLSRWFPKEVTPAHVGAYEVRRKPNGHQLAKWFSWWDGAHWGRTSQTPEGAEQDGYLWSAEAISEGGFEWRGVLMARLKR